MTSKRFIEFNGEHINIGLVTRYGRGENKMRDKEDGNYSLYICFCGDDDLVIWYKSESERDSNFMVLDGYIND
jgi:hypothetical protein